MINQSVDQQIDNAEGLGIRQLRQMQQTNPELVVGVALENLQQELIANERQRQMDMRPDATPPDVIGQTYNEVSSMLGGAGQSPELQQPPMVAQGIPQPPMVAEGIPQLPAQNMAMGAQGGIVGYADGGITGDEIQRRNRANAEYTRTRPTEYTTLEGEVLSFPDGVPTSEEMARGLRTSEEQTQVERERAAHGEFRRRVMTPSRDRALEGLNRIISEGTYDSESEEYLSTRPIPALINKYGEALVMGFLEGEKELREEGKYVAPEYADAYKQKRDNFYSHYPQYFLEDVYETREGPIDISEDLSMAGGGIVSLQEGGLLEVGDRTQEGELIVAMVKGVMGVIPVTEAEYEAWTQDGSLPSNRNLSTPTFRQAVKQGVGIDLPTFTPTPGSPEENLMQGNVLTGPATGNVLEGPGGLASEMGEILDSDAHWSEKVGRGGIATGEAGLQSLLKTIGGGWEGIEYGGRLLGGAGKGAGEQLDMKGREQVEAAIESASVQFTSDMAPLIDQLNELRNSDLALDDPRILAIQDQIAAARQAHEEQVARLKATPTLGGAVMNIPQDISKWMQMYEDDPSSSWVGRTLGGIQDVREEQRIEGLNTAAQAELAANAEAAAPVTPAEWLAEQQRAFDASGARSQRPSMATKEVVGGGEQEERNWLDKTMSVLELLGQAGGASKGYEFAQINEREAAKQALTEANEFDMAKQQALLDQRTEERNMILNQQRQIERATAMAGITVGEISMDPLVTAERERLIEEHDVFFGGHDEEAVQRDLNAFILRLLNQRRQETGALFNTTAGGGTSTNPPASGVPSNVTVTRSP